MKKFVIIALGVTLIFFNSCIQGKKDNAINIDPLPSWKDGETKKSILKFVQEVTDSTSDNYVVIPDRIAVFDNDGNLWSEQPSYFQAFFALYRIKILAAQHPEWKNEQPFKAVLENDIDELKKYGEHEIFKLVMATHSGITTDEFSEAVKDWLLNAKHPRFNRPFTDLVYQPMLELIVFLQNNDFKTFIVSGGGIDFMRPWVEEIYGIPRDQVVGSSIKTEFVIKGDTPEIMKLPEIDFIDDKEGKPVGIHRFIGRKPIFCSGNSDGDLAMMKYTASGKGKRFMLYLHHTDSIREWAYDRKSSAGRFDEGLDEAIKQGWTITNMKEDWKVVYPFELKRD